MALSSGPANLTKNGLTHGASISAETLNDFAMRMCAVNVLNHVSFVVDYPEIATEACSHFIERISKSSILSVF